jgi:hypothetical protein
MAEFSKQYCERKFPEMPGDFDILEMAKDLSNGNYVPMICEGYGFIAIGKDETGSIVLAFPEDSNPTPSAIWKPYEEVVV